VTRTKY